MKNLLILALSFFLTKSMNAQIKMSEPSDIQVPPAKPAGLLMKDGKMVEVKSGLSKAIEEDITLENGTIVMKDGNVKTTDGKIIVLKEGDWIMMDGTTKIKTVKKKRTKSKH